jgi:hypothetical protein
MMWRWIEQNKPAIDYVRHINSGRIIKYAHLTNDIGDGARSNSPHVDDRGYARFDLCLIQLPLGTPVVLQDVSSVAITISFSRRRWGCKRSFESLAGINEKISVPLWQQRDTDLNKDLGPEEALLEVIWVDWIILVYKQWPRVFWHDIIYCSVTDASFHTVQALALRIGLANEGWDSPVAMPVPLGRT